MGIGDRGSGIGDRGTGNREQGQIYSDYHILVIWGNLRYETTYTNPCFMRISACVL